MKPTKTPFESHVHYWTFETSKYKKLPYLYFVLGSLLALAFYPVFNRLAGTLRPDFSGQTTFNPSFNPINIIVMLVIIILVFALHEMVHGLFLRLFTQESPKYEVGSWYIHVDAPGWYLPRNQFLITSLSPLCLLTLAGTMLLTFVPEAAVGPVVLGMTANAAGSIADMASSLLIFLLPASSFINTKGEIYVGESFHSQQGQVCSSSWKQRILLLVVGVLSKLEGP